MKLKLPKLKNLLKPAPLTAIGLVLLGVNQFTVFPSWLGTTTAVLIIGGSGWALLKMLGFVKK